MTNTRFKTPSEMEYTKQSHALIHLFIQTPHVDLEELIFIDFRPAWLIPQQRVYAALPSSTCHICMYEYFIEAQQVQHDSRHPVICKKCFRRVKSCPFCRIPLVHFYKFQLQGVNILVRSL